MRIPIDSIDFLIFEFDRVYYIAFKKDRDKTFWICSYSLMTKDGKKIRIFNMISERDHQKEMSEYENFDNNENYYEYGKEILKTLSYELGKKSLIMNYVKMPAGNPQYK